MIINELSNELGVKNKDVISYLKAQGFKVSSHLQTATDEMIDAARDNFIKKAVEVTEIVEEDIPTTSKTTSKAVTIARALKKFDPEDLIACRSIVPWRLAAVGVDRMTIYRWPSFGTVEYVRFKDLQSWRAKNIIKKSKIIIEDPDLCELWKHDLGETYKKFLNVNYPEELFDVSDDEFQRTLETAPNTFKEVLKYTAMDMIHNENYPDTSKIIIMDKVLGTCIKDFI